MKKYFEWFGLFPLPLLAMIPILSLKSQEETKKQAINTCIGYTCSLTIGILLYILLIHTKLNNHIALLISIILWVVLFIIRKKILS